MTLRESRLQLGSNCSFGGNIKRTRIKSGALWNIYKPRRREQETLRAEPSVDISPRKTYRSPKST